jgi:hypothetical protein
VKSDGKSRKRIDELTSLVQKHSDDADFFREKEEEFQEQNKVYLPYIMGGRRSLDRMVVGFTTKYAISAYHHFSCKLKCDSIFVILSQ